MVGGETGALLGSNADGLPVVALVGRANAGKSTLFNRIVRSRRALVSPIPGTTRDLNASPAEYDGRRFLLVDSGGLEIGETQRLTELVTREALRAVAAADVVVLVVDGRAGVSPADHATVALIREVNRPMVLAVNKLDRGRMESQAGEFYELGAEQLFSISAAHGHGVDELVEAIVAHLPEAPAAASQPAELRVALVGRPNVGKSSLLNRLAGFQRAIVDEAPGTTRDPVDIRLQYEGREIILIDTAGIRRPAKVEGGLEQDAVGRAINTIRRAEVLALVVDASEGITDQDARLARLVDHEDRALLVVCNKWDVASRLGRKIEAFRRDASERYPFLQFAPMVFTSALTGDGVRELMVTALKVGANFRARLQTAVLNRALTEAAAAMDPPVVAGRRLNLLYVTQVSSSPPRLVLFSNLQRDIPAHYVRFLETRFRQEFHLEGTPLRLEFRKRAASGGRGEPKESPGRVSASASQHAERRRQ